MHIFLNDELEPYQEWRNPEIVNYSLILILFHVMVHRLIKPQFKSKLKYTLSECLIKVAHYNLDLADDDTYISGHNLFVSAELSLRDNRNRWIWDRVSGQGKEYWQTAKSESVHNQKMSVGRKREFCKEWQEEGPRGRQKGKRKRMRGEENHVQMQLPECRIPVHMRVRPTEMITLVAWKKAFTKSRKPTDLVHMGLLKWETERRGQKIWLLVPRRPMPPGLDPEKAVIYKYRRRTEVEWGEKTRGNNLQKWRVINNNAVLAYTRERVRTRIEGL